MSESFDDIKSWIMEKYFYSPIKDGSKAEDTPLYLWISKQRAVATADEKMITEAAQKMGYLPSKEMLAEWIARCASDAIAK